MHTEPRVRPATPVEAAHFIEETCRELGDLARRSRLGLLAYLLDVARLEASEASRPAGGAEGCTAPLQRVAGGR